MTIKNLIDEDFVNYKKTSMFIGFPTCSWKCEKECGKKVCQNGTLSNSPDLHIDVEDICKRYIENDISHAIVCGGLEPFDSWGDLISLISYMRKFTNDDVVIYTGYNKEELIEKIGILKSFKNIVVKFGRFIPGMEPHYDDILGILLASDNQYAERIS